MDPHFDFNVLDMPHLRRWWCKLLLDNYGIEGCGKRFCHFTQEGHQMVNGLLAPVFRVTRKQKVLTKTTEADQTIGEAEDWLLLTASQLEQQQRADETLALVRDWLEAGQRPSWPEVSARGPEVLQLVHGSVGAGHYGNAKTLHRLRGRFYWPGCRRDVELHVHCCDTCAGQRGSSLRGFSVINGLFLWGRELVSSGTPPRHRPTQCPASALLLPPCFVSPPAPYVCPSPPLIHR
ncbi:unnamed protein product [Gadus morhua 'NCC']